MTAEDARVTRGWGHHPDKTDGSDAATKKPGDVDGREGVAKSKKGATTPEQRALAAAPGDTPAHRDARAAVAKDFFDRNGMGEDYESLEKGIDMSKPVEVVRYPPPEKVHQYVRNPSEKYPTPAIGNWVDPKGGQTGNELGLNDNPAYRTPATLSVPPAAQGERREALQSTAAPIVDDWTNKPTPVDTDGWDAMDYHTKGSQRYRRCESGLQVKGQG